MKRTKTNAFVVALLALAVSSSALAVGGKGRETKDSKGRETKLENSKTEAAGLSGVRAQVVRRFTNIYKALKTESSAELQSLNFTPADSRVMLKRSALAYEKGLYGARQEALLEAVEANANKPEFQALFINNAVLAAKDMLHDGNLKWEEKITIDGKEQTVQINSMNFTTGEALMIGKGSSPRMVKFFNRKTQLEKEGKSTREAMIESLKELEISWEEFVRRCLLAK